MSDDELDRIGRSLEDSRRRLAANRRESWEAPRPPAPPPRTPREDRKNLWAGGIALLAIIGVIMLFSGALAGLSSTSYADAIDAHCESFDGSQTIATCKSEARAIFFDCRGQEPDIDLADSMCDDKAEGWQP